MVLQEAQGMFENNPWRPKGEFTLEVNNKKERERSRN